MTRVLLVLAAAVAERGGQPRRRAIDLVIAATGHGVASSPATPDFAIIDDLVRVHSNP